MLVSFVGSPFQLTLSVDIFYLSILNCNRHAAKSAANVLVVYVYFWQHSHKQQIKDMLYILLSFIKFALCFKRVTF